MNIELDEIVVLDVSDDALEMAADTQTALTWGYRPQTEAWNFSGC